MKISKIELIPIKAERGLIAFANVTLDESLFIGSIGVHTKLDRSGYRLTYPTKKVGSIHITICHPITPELSKLIEEKIIAKVEELFALN
jgi:DNA-binding cell septation regulator SpoVG